MAKKDKQKEVDTSKEDTETTADDAEVEVEAPTKYELLGQVVDAQIRDEEEAGNVAFHDYAVGVMKGILNPDPAEVDDAEGEDSTEADEEGSDDASTDEVTDEVKED